MGTTSRITGVTMAVVAATLLSAQKVTLAQSAPANAAALHTAVTSPT